MNKSKPLVSNPQNKLAHQRKYSPFEEVQKIDRKKVFDYSKKFHVDEEIKTILNYYNKIK